MSGSQIASAIWLTGMDENAVRRSEAEKGHPQGDRAAMRRLPPQSMAGSHLERDEKEKKVRSNHGLTLFIRCGSNTPCLAPAWMDGKMRDGESIHLQAAQCFGADVSLGACGEVSPSGDE